MTHFVKDTLPNGKSFDRPLVHHSDLYADPLKMKFIHTMETCPSNRISGTRYIGEDDDLDMGPVFEIEFKFPFENLEQELASAYWGSLDLEFGKYIIEDDGVRIFAQAHPSCYCNDNFDCYYEINNLNALKGHFCSGGIFDLTVYFHEVGNGYTVPETEDENSYFYDLVEEIDGNVGDATDEELEELITDDGFTKTFETTDGRVWRLFAIENRD